MPLNTRIDSSTWPIIRGLRKMANCASKESCAWWRGVRGKYRYSNSALAKATSARMPNALRQPRVSAIKVPTGMPKTVAQTTPKLIFAIAHPARSGPTMSTAVSLAKAQKTGKPNAGIRRARPIT
ncbi:hypothetical protein D9M71_405570 [compost metagenome]